MSEAKKISGHGRCKATEVEYHQPMCFVDQKSELILNFDSALAPLSVGAVKIWTVDESSTSQLVPVAQTAEPEMTSEDKPKRLSLIADFNLLQMRANLARNSWYGTSWAQPTVPPQLIPRNWDLATSHLAELQIYRQSLNRRARSLSKNLESVDLFIGSGWNSVGLEVKANASVDGQLGVWTSMGAAAIDGQHRYTLQQEIWDYLVSAARRTRLVLKQALIVVRRSQKRVSAAISILIQQQFRFACSVFCSVRWERRRWFLCHTSHPPKSLATAVAGLFLGACFGSPLA